MKRLKKQPLGPNRLRVDRSRLLHHMEVTTRSRNIQKPAERGTHSPPRSAVPRRAQCPAATAPGCAGIGAALGNSKTPK